MARDYSSFGGRRLNVGESGIPSRLLVCVRAPTKAGTTRFTLTAPKAHGILFFNFDRPLRDNVPDLKSLIGKAELIEIDCTAWARGGNDAQDRAKKVVQNLRNAAHQAIKDGISTVVIDKATDLHEALPWAAFGAESKIVRSGQKLWKEKGPQNTYWKNLLQPFKATSCKTNLVLVHRTKDEYGDDDKTTGETLPRGYEDIEYECTVSVELMKDRTLQGAKKFSLRVSDCTFNTGAEEQELKGKMVNFADLAMLIAPESEEGDWA